MTEFWLIAVALAAVAALVAAYPLLRRATDPETADRGAVNLALYEERLAELSAQRDSGELEPQEYEALKAELGRTLLQDNPQAVSRSQPLRGTGWVPWLAVVLVPVLALAIYAWHGNMADVEIAALSQQPPTRVQQAQLADRLERRVAQRPEALQSRLLLARTYMGLQQFDRAVEHYAAIVAIDPESPMVMGEYAQALYLANDNRMTPEATAVAERTLAMDPSNLTVLGILGIDAFQQQNFTQALAYWDRVLANAPENSAAARAVAAMRQRTLAILEQEGEEPTAGASPAATGPQVQVQVSLAPELDAAADTAVFVFARAAEGPPMPLAVQRLTVADLPATITLDESMAMMPELKLSNFPRIELVARVSQAGTPSAASGDLEGRAGPFATNELPAEPVTLEIDQRLP